MVVFLYCAIILSGTLLVLMASLERLLGRPIPRLRYSKPVPKQIGYIIVPAMMFQILVGFLIQLPRESYRQAPNGWQRFLEAANIVLMAVAFAGCVGFLLFVVCWFGYLAARIVAGIARLLAKWQK